MTKNIKKMKQQSEYFIEHRAFLSFISFGEQIKFFLSMQASGHFGSFPKVRPSSIKLNLDYGRKL